MAAPFVDERRCGYALDVISDGSAHTGHGTLLFSVLRSPSNIENEQDDSVILRRYAFGYCENMGRLAQDQKQKLAKITAVFLPTKDVESTAGLPSLLLTLSNVGSEQLSIIGPPPIAKYLQFTTNMILGKRLYPKVRICEVPAVLRTSSNGKRNYNGEKKKTSIEHTNESSWWNVFQDEYLQVHARSFNFLDLNKPSWLADDNSSCSHTDDDMSKTPKRQQVVVVAYVVTVFGSTSSNSFSFSVAPNEVPLYPLPAPLPACPLKFSIAWAGFFHKSKVNTIFNLPLASFTYEINKLLYNNSKDDDSHCIVPDEWDRGILCHAAASSQNFHNMLPFVFPKSRAILTAEQNQINQQSEEEEEETNTKKLLDDDDDIIRLRTGDSLRFKLLDSPLKKPTILSFPYRHNNSNNAKSTKSCPTTINTATVAAKTSFLNSLLKHDSPRDENEINFDENDDDETSESSAKSKCPDYSSSFNFVDPYLLVLGTGCAAPSALRGSSSYAIFLPFCNQTITRTTASTTLPPINNNNNNSCNKLSLFALLDCGEGCLTSLEQYVPQSISLSESLLSLRLIWISHAHLDHYGGLATIIKAIDDATDSEGEDGDDCKPMVIAPLKVLQYLDECLGCENGIITSSKIDSNNNKKKIPHRLFYGTTHSDFELNSMRSSSTNNTVRDKLFGYQVRHCKTQQPWKPIGSLKNIPVEHCPNAHALIIDFQYPDAESNCAKETKFSLCYSGDCRPSSALISECIRHHKRPDLVIHEATFDDDMRQEAISKRHCTVSEALDVVKKTGVKACLLSHFSQRYSRTSSNTGIDSSSQDNGGDTLRRTVNFCSAIDGLFMPLTETFLSSLSLLDAVIASFDNLQE